jgi:hypothetical protein
MFPSSGKVMGAPTLLGGFFPGMWHQLFAKECLRQAMWSWKLQDLTWKVNSDVSVSLTFCTFRRDAVHERVLTPRFLCIVAYT